MRQAPGFERIGCRPTLRLDLGKDLDGCGEAGGRRHVPMRMSIMKFPHMIASTKSGSRTNWMDMATRGSDNSDSRA